MFVRSAKAASRRLNSRHVLLGAGSALLSYSVCQPATLRSESVKDKIWPDNEARAGSSSSRGGGGKNVSASDDSDDASRHAYFGNFDDAAWASFSKRFAEAGASITNVEWSSIRDKITDLIVPEWTQSIPAYVRKLQAELESRPGSLVDEILQESEDPYINPEIQRTAYVRISKELCPEEVAFQRARRRHTTKALAQYLDLVENDIDPDDVPIIAMCGSGGGLRALVAGSSSYLCAQQAGLFDCVTYTAGVSGSCWLQTLYHSSVGAQDFGKLLKHLKRRLDVHIAFPPPALNLLTTAPTNKFLLSGLLEKAKADPNAEFGLVDIYGLLLAARLLVPRGELEIETQDLKISHQRVNTDAGTHPLPIYCAVRHEIPLNESDTTKQMVKQIPSDNAKVRAKQESWFQWFEWTPYEFWCDEVDAGIPTWALGRRFRDGRSVPRDSGLELPEMRLPQLLGIWGSAFCATLSHYYKEIRPIIEGIAGFGGLDDLISERNDDLVKVHPIDPATIPNFMTGLGAQLPKTTPRSMIKQPHLQLMDAGMSNNLPIYPLLRPGRDIDIVVAFDASADIKKENWLAVADGYAKQRGIKGWPVGAGWPGGSASLEQQATELEEAQASSAAEAAEKVTAAKKAQAKELQEEQQEHPDSQVATSAQRPEHLPPAPHAMMKDLGHCTVWVGTTEERDSTTTDSGNPPSTRIDGDSDPGSWDLMSAAADPGIAVIYFPLTPNEKVAGVDPERSAFMSTWNSIYTPEEIDKVAALAKANWDEGAEQTRRCVRAVYERKKRQRLERETKAIEKRWRRRWRDGEV